MRLGGLHVECRDRVRGVGHTCSVRSQTGRLGLAVVTLSGERFLTASATRVIPADPGTGSAYSPGN